MLFETAVGDAYGMAWEFAPTQMAANDLSGFQVNPRYLDFPAGCYSDDTMRSLANATVVLGDRSAWFDPAAYVKAYQEIHAKDPRQGWSRGFQAHLEAHRNSSPLQFMLSLRRRATNGAVMGVAPLGYLPHENFVRMAATAQTISTHAGGASSSAQAIALAAHYLIHKKGPLSSLLDYLEKEVDWDSEDERRRILTHYGHPVPVPAMPAWTIATGAIFTLVDTEFTGLADRLQWTVSRGGDTDSLAAVTMALCSCSDEIPNDLPPSLTDHVESEISRSNLKDMDHRLRTFIATTSWH